MGKRVRRKRGWGGKLKLALKIIFWPIFILVVIGGFVLAGIVQGLEDARKNNPRR